MPNTTPFPVSLNRLNRLYLKIVPDLRYILVTWAGMPLGMPIFSSIFSTFLASSSPPWRPPFSRRYASLPSPVNPHATKLYQWVLEVMFHHVVHFICFIHISPSRLTPFTPLVAFLRLAARSLFSLVLFKWFESIFIGNASRGFIYLLLGALYVNLLGYLFIILSYTPPALSPTLARRFRLCAWRR